MRVLFVCNLNSVRSPMAAVIAASLMLPGLAVSSAGLEPGEADPFAAAVLAEEGLDMSGHVPAPLDEAGLSGFDRIICLTPEAHERVLALLGSAKGKEASVAYWQTLDPFAGSGSENREQRLMAYRALRDQLRGLIAGSFSGRETERG